MKLLVEIDLGPRWDSQTNLDAAMFVSGKLYMANLPHTFINLDREN